MRAVCDMPYQLISSHIFISALINISLLMLNFIITTRIHITKHYHKYIEAIYIFELLGYLKSILLFLQYVIKLHLYYRTAECILLYNKSVCFKAYCNLLHFLSVSYGKLKFAS